MTRSYSIKPSLDNAYARVHRADQHLMRLEREVVLFLRSGPLFPVTIPRYATGTFTASSQVVPSIISILIGETVYNLRAALDYLIYELAILDSGDLQEGTQFPIEDRPQGWRRNRGTYLKGLSPKHQAAIEALQPYSGCDWTGTLRNLSNPDKHRSLITAEYGVILSTNISDKARTITRDTLQLLFDDARPVVETLRVLHSQVTQVLDTFHPGF